ncbi:MAG: SDR family NAD(P)-dependent oxidoreductase [Luteolibacter sp.]
MSGFSNQVVVVTGASSGVGRAIALALAENGATVALVGRELKTLEAVASSAPERMKCYVADLLDDAALPDLKQRITADFGGIDGLVHSAGVFAMGRLETAPLADFDLQYRCNVRAPFALTQIFLPSLVERQGQIVFINSTAGLSAGGGVSQYAATKHALKAVADSLRQEVNSQGVRVLSVYLGRTATPMQEAICKTEGKPYDPAYFIQPHDVAETLLHTLSLSRTAEIIDVTLRPMKKPPLA